MPMTLDEAKLFYLPQQILTDDREVLVATIDAEILTYTLVSLDAWGNRRSFQRGINPETLKLLLTDWLKSEFNIDFERFHGVS